jgi:hypothetical protein
LKSARAAQRTIKTKERFVQARIEEDMLWLEGLEDELADVRSRPQLATGQVDDVDVLSRIEKQMLDLETLEDELADVRLMRVSAMEQVVGVKDSLELLGIVEPEADVPKPFTSKKSRARGKKKADEDHGTEDPEAKHSPYNPQPTPVQNNPASESSGLPPSSHALPPVSSLADNPPLSPSPLNPSTGSWADRSNMTENEAVRAWALSVQMVISLPLP